MEALGIDVGGVITNCASDPEGPRLANPDTYLSTPFMPGVVPAIKQLITQRFGARTYVVSKCGPATQARTIDLLTKRNFFAETGLTLDRVHFCLTRDAKAPIVRQLGLTHFIDNRLEVLNHMIGVVPHLYLFKPDDDEVAAYAQYLPAVTRVDSATELIAAILG